MKEPESRVGWGQIEGTVSRDRYFERRSRRGGWDRVKLKERCHKEPERGVGWSQIERTVSRDGYFE